MKFWSRMVGVGEGWVRRHDREMGAPPPAPLGLTFHSTAVIIRRTARGSVKAGDGDAICCSPVLEKRAVAHYHTPQLQLRVKKTSPLSPVRSLPTHRSFCEFRFDIFIPSTRDCAVCALPWRILAKMLRYIQGEHKVFPWLQTFVTRKLRGIQTYFFFTIKLVSKILYHVFIVTFVFWMQHFQTGGLGEIVRHPGHHDRQISPPPPWLLFMGVY